MGRILSLLALTFLVSGCLNIKNSMNGSSNGGSSSNENRPSSGSEGVIGYIVKPSNISVTARPGHGVTIAAPANTVANGTKDASDVLVTVYDPQEVLLRDFLAASGRARLRADLLDGNYANSNGSFSVTYEGLPKRFLLIAVDQEPGLNEVSVNDVDDFDRPMYVLMVRKQDGSYQDAVSLIKEMIDGWIVDICSKPEIKPYCDAAKAK